MELWQYYRILRKRKWLIIIGTLICMSAAGAFLFLRQQPYTATTTVMERLQDSSSMSIFGGSSYEIDPRIHLANLMQTAKSSPVKEGAVRKFENRSVAASSDPRSIISTLNVEPIPDTMVLSLSVQSQNSRDAMDGANYVAQSLIERYNEQKFGGVSKTRQFLGGQLPIARAQLLKIREGLRKYKVGSDSIMLPSQTQALIAELSQFKTSLNQYQVTAKEADAKVKSLRSQLAKYPESRTTAVTMQSNPVWQQLQMELAKQQIELQKMLKDRTPQHPEVLALQQQIQETQRRLNEQGATIMGAQTESANPIRDNLVQNYVSAMTEASTAKAAAKAAKQVLLGMRPELSGLPQKEAKLAALSAEEDAARNTYALLKQKYDEALIREKEATSVSALLIVDEAQIATVDRKSKLLKLLLSVIFGFFFSAGMAFLLNYLDNTVKTPIEAEQLLQLPVFAVVPLSRVHSLLDKKSLPAIGTSYQMLTANLWIKSGDMNQRTFLVASAEPNVGRSSTAANLAITLASDGARVILVDADFRQPSLHTIFGVENERGLSNVLVGQLSLRDALKLTTTPDVLLITSGPQPVNPVRLLRSPEMANLVAELNELADFIIFDSPTGVTFADATLLASLVKNVILVHAAGNVPRGAEEEFRNRLELVDANLMGVVLNMVKPEDSHGYYHFRSSYGELLRNGKHMAALPGSSTRYTSGE